MPCPRFHSPALLCVLCVSVVQSLISKLATRDSALATSFPFHPISPISQLLFRQMFEHLFTVPHHPMLCCEQAPPHPFTDLHYRAAKNSHRSAPSYSTRYPPTLSISHPLSCSIYGRGGRGVRFLFLLPSEAGSHVRCTSYKSAGQSAFSALPAGTISRGF